MGIYEVGVYLVIIVVASVCVFGIMWLLMRSMAPKRPRSRKRTALAAAASGQPPKQLSRPSGDNGVDKKNKKNKKEKKDKNRKAPGGREEKLLKLKEMPDNRLLSQGESAASSQNKPKDSMEKAENEKEMPPVAAGGGSEEGAAPEASADTAGQENAALELPDLPSMDTLTTEDDAPKEEEIDLMSVFESEDSEDSTTSDLAANLFDVDVENIEKLGSEVSDFLNGMRSR